MTRKTRIPTLALLLALLPGPAWAAEEKPINELRLLDGRVLIDVTVLGYNETSFMAKWQGGRGAISYSNLEPDKQREFEGRRPSNKSGNGYSKQSPRENQAAAPNGTLSIGKINLREVETMSSYVRYSWQAEVVNNTDTTQTVTAKLKMFDRDGFELDRDLSSEIRVRAGQRATATSTSMMKADVWAQVKRYTVELR